MTLVEAAVQRTFEVGDLPGGQVKGTTLRDAALVELTRMVRHARAAQVKSLQIEPAPITIKGLTYREEWAAYFHSLKRTWTRAVITLLVTVLFSVFAISDVIGFVRTGTYILHPYFSMVLALASTLLFVVAISSIVGTKRRLEGFIWDTLKSSPLRH